MKTVLTFILLTFLLHGHAQTDTLYANQTHSLAIFFPSTIRQALPGSGNFTFSYNRDKPQHFGLLQASPGPGSNLLVLTNDSQVYSFALQYKGELPQTNRFIELDESIGHEMQSITIPKFKEAKERPVSTTISNKRQIIKEGYFENICTSLIKKNTRELKSTRKNGMRLALRNAQYLNREVFLVLEIGNHSGIDFELEFLKLFKVNGNNSRKSSFQRIEMIPIYVHAYPSLVNNNSKRCFVYVLPKFTLGDSETLLFELEEKRGSRNIRLGLRKIVF